MTDETPIPATLEAEAAFADLLVSQGRCSREQVDECFSILRGLAELGASPRPDLADLLSRKGYLRDSAEKSAATAPARLPPEAAAKAEDPSNLLGKYVRVARLGIGGMAEVWKAWDRDLKRWVALKILLRNEREDLARFVREAQAAASLDHPDICSVYEIGCEQGRHFIAMQLVEGRTLDQVAGGDARRAADLVRRAAKAVHAAHGKGIIHRDLKPANIMVSEQGRVYVMDFGLAKTMNVATSLSATGTVVGTPAYMSPEQVAGGRNVDPRTDVYSLGCTLYRLLAGRPPFQDTNAYELLTKVVTEDPPKLRGVCPRLEAIVMKCLEKSRDRRYATAAELAADLGRWLKGEPTVAYAASRAARLGRFLLRKKSPLLVAAGLLLLGSAVGAWLVVADSRRADRIREGLMEAARLEREGKTADARDAYRRILELDRGNATAATGYTRTDAAWKKSEEEAARTRAWREAYKLLEAGRPTLDRARGCLYDAKADYKELMARLDEAEGFIRKAVGEAPELAQGHYLQGMIWELRGWYDRAERCWRKAIEVDPDFGMAHYHLGRLLMTRALLAGIVLKGQESAHSSREQGRFVREAIAELKAATASPSGIDDPLTRGFARAMLTYLRGDSSHDARIWADLRRFRGRQGGEDYLYWAALVSRGEERRKFLDEAIERRPKSPMALYFRGVVREESGGWKEAIEDYTAAATFHPRFFHAYNNRGAARAKTGDWKGAITDYTKAIALDPTFNAAYNNRGLARAHEGDFAGAIADYSRSLEIDRKQPWVFFCRGQARVKRGDFPEATADFTEALNLGSRHADVYSQRGAARERQKDLSGAIADYDEALRLNARHLPSYVRRGNVRSLSGDRDGAIADWTKALELSPKGSAQHEEIKRGLERVRTRK